MIKATNLHKSFGDLKVLSDFSIEINTGETIVILGQSGEGKSVFLKHIIGIEKPDEGSLEIDGVCISSLKGPELYQAIRHTGMLFQGGALFDSLNVFDNTAFYLHQHERLHSSEIESRVRTALDMVGLKDVEQKMPSELSGGMRKRAALARLIVYRPQILLYDEPTTGLDPIYSMQINELIIKTKQELNATSIVVTHDMPSALKIGDRIAMIDQGKIVFIGNKEEFLASDNKTIQSFIENAIPKGLSHG